MGSTTVPFSFSPSATLAQIIQYSVQYSLAGQHSSVFIGIYLLSLGFALCLTLNTA